MSTVSCIWKPSFYCTHSRTLQLFIHALSAQPQKSSHVTQHVLFSFSFLFFANSDFTKQDVSNVEGKPQKCDNFSETSILEEVGLCWTELQQKWQKVMSVCRWSTQHRVSETPFRSRVQHFLPILL